MIQFTTKCLLLFATLSLLNARLVNSADAQAKLNVLLILIDDLRPALGCYDDPLAHTPHIDRFAETARQFNRAYVQQAVCGPSRTALLTGLLPDSTGVWHNRNRFRERLPDWITLPQLFKHHGYQTQSLGKVFSGNERELDPDSWSGELLRRPDWQRYLLPENQGTALKHAAWEAPDVADEAYSDGQLAELAVETLSEFEHKEPFFLAVGFFKPHLPFNAPRKYWQMHQRSTFHLPNNDAAHAQHAARAMSEFALHTHRELGGYRGIPKNEQLASDTAAELRHGYYACVSYVDAQIGKLLAELRAHQLEDRTIVVLLGDHGFALGETGRWCKGTNFELDTRVPLLIRTPHLNQAGVATDAIVEAIDLYPTLAELTGVQVVPGLDGKSFAKVIENPSVLHREFALSQFNRPWSSKDPKVMGYSIRNKSSRYTRWVDWSSRQILSEEWYDYTEQQRTFGTAAYLFETKNSAADQPRELTDMRRKMDTMLNARIRQ